MTVIYNPFDPAFTENPYPTLKALRDEAPAYRIVEAEGVWLLTRYQDIDEILRDRDRFSVDHRNLKRGPEQPVPYERIASILFRDPPEHTRWRRQLAKGLTPAHVEAFRPRVAELVDGLLDTIEEKGEVDFVAEYSTVLPFRVISELLGTPVADRPQLYAWVSDIVNITEPVASPEVSEAIVRSSDEMRVYMRDLCKYKRANPAGDVISRLATAGNDDGFNDDELVEHVMLLQVSAPDPSSNLLAQGVLALARNPEQAQALRDDPSLDTNAVEEVLRYEAPLQMTGRYGLEDIELHGQRIEAGTAVVMSIASANHDQEKWGPTADDLDLRRERAQDHLSFARGIHTCFGAALARLQGRETFGRLVRRFPDVNLTAQPQWNFLLNRRGPMTVPISVR
jgi:cytochrome P450